MIDSSHIEVIGNAPDSIAEGMALTVVIPGWKASQDEWSNIVLEPR